MDYASEKIRLMNELCEDYFNGMAKRFPVLLRELDDDPGYEPRLICDFCVHEYPCNMCVYGDRI